MTDTQWQSAMVKCISAFRKYDALLDKMESEYERRYGVHPSDVYDDYWIDTFRWCNGDDAPDIEMVKANAELCMKGDSNDRE